MLPVLGEEQAIKCVDAASPLEHTTTVRRVEHIRRVYRCAEIHDARTYMSTIGSSRRSKRKHVPMDDARTSIYYTPDSLCAASSNHPELLLFASWRLQYILSGAQREEGSEATHKNPHL